MVEEKRFTLDEAHRYFAIEFNNAIFGLAEKPTLTALEKEEIIQKAHSAVLHWQKFSKSTIANSQRGYYMVAKAYVAVGETENALKYSKLCYDITCKNEDKLFDWDLAYAFEIMARTFAMNNDTKNFKKFYKKAQQQELKIKDQGDLKYFSSDFKSGNWFGLLK